MPCKNRPAPFPGHLPLYDKMMLSVLMAIFLGEPGLEGFIEAKDDGSGADNWSYKSRKAPVKSSPPINRHPMFYRPGMRYL